MRKTPASFCAAMALSWSGTAAAADTCNSIAAMATGPNSQLHKISVNANSSGKLEVRLDGEPDAVTGASECSAYAPADGFELSCSWVVTSYDEARGRFDLLKLKLEKCFRRSLDDRTYPSSVEGLTVHARHRLDVVDDTGEIETDISLTLHEHERASGPNGFYVGLSIAR